jgi:hypothetical protein
MRISMLGHRFLFAALCSLCISGGADAQTITFPGACDASAAIALNDNTIIVSDDEKPWLGIYNLDTGELQSTVPLPFADQISAVKDDE